MYTAKHVDENMTYVGFFEGLVISVTDELIWQEISKMAAKFISI